MDLKDFLAFMMDDIQIGKDQPSLREESRRKFYDTLKNVQADGICLFSSLL